MDTQKLQQLKDDKGVVLVEMYASWCPHCQRMMPVVAEVKEQFAGKANVYQFDIDKNEEMADKLGVNTIPTFIVYKNGEEMWRGTGEMEASVLASHIQDVLNK